MLHLYSHQLIQFSTDTLTPKKRRLHPRHSQDFHFEISLPPSSPGLKKKRVLSFVMKVTTKVGNLEYKVHKSKLNLVSKGRFEGDEIFRHSKKMRHQNAAKQTNISSNWKRSVPIPFTSKNDSYLVKDASCFLSWSEIVFFLPGAPPGTFGSKGLQAEIDFWVNSVSFAVHQPKQKPKKSHANLLCGLVVQRSPFYLWRKKYGKSKQIKPIHPENSPLLAGTENERCPYCPGILFRVFRKFYVHHKGHPEVVTPWHVSPGTFLLFLHLHTVSNEVGTHGTQKASGIPGPRPTFGRHENLPVVISLEMMERNQEIWSVLPRKCKQCPPSQVKLCW